MPASTAFQTAIAASIAAADEVIRYGNQVEGVTEQLVSDKINSVNSLQAQLTQAQTDLATANAANSALTSQLNNALAAVADMKVAGQAVLNAAAARGL